MNIISTDISYFYWILNILRLTKKIVFARGIYNALKNHLNSFLVTLHHLCAPVFPPSYIQILSILNTVTTNMSLVNHSQTELGTWNLDIMFTIPFVLCVLCHTSNITCHLSHITYQIFVLFFFQIVGVRWWIVYNQWGVPRLCVYTFSKGINFE